MVRTRERPLTPEERAWLDAPHLDPRYGTNLSHNDWSKKIARDVRAAHGMFRGSQEERDLEQEAAGELARKLPQFDAAAHVPPGGNAAMAFRGWVKRSVWCACDRAALRLKNGGTYHTTRTPPAPVGDGVGESRPADDGFGAGVVEVGDVVCRLSGAALEVESEPDLHQWAVAVGELDARLSGCLWHLGDLALYGVRRFGPDASDMLKALGYANKTVSKALLVSRRFPAEMRISGASWTHHAVAAALGRAKARALLRKCVRERLSVNQLKALLPERALPAPGGLTRAALARLPEVAGRHGVSADVVLAVLRELRA